MFRYINKGFFTLFAVISAVLLSYLFAYNIGYDNGREKYYAETDQRLERELILLNNRLVIGNHFYRCTIQE